MEYIAGWINTSLSRDATYKLLGENGEEHIEVGAGHSLFSSEGRLHSSDGILLLYTGRPTLAGGNTRDDISNRIIRLYRAQGEEFVTSVGGAFSLALYDMKEEKLVLVIDRIGQKSLCFARLANGLVFGTTTDLIRYHPDVRFEISPQSIYDYLYFHHCPSPRSIYSGINKLEGAQSLVFKDGEQRLNKYWQPDFCEQPSDDLEQLSTELLETLTRATRELIDTPSTTGAFLSGGLDSSSVVGALDQAFPGQAQTFSIGFPVEGYDELEYARLAVDAFNATANEYYITPEDVVDMVPRIAEYYDEPFGNSSALPTYYCARMARNAGMDCLLAGDGGDELFAGNVRYTEQAVFGRYQKVPGFLRTVLEATLRGVPRGIRSYGLLHKVSRYVSLANTPLPDRLQDYNFLTRNQPEDMFNPAFLEQIDNSVPLAQLRARYNELPDITDLNRMMYLDWKTTLHDNDLVKVNRMCELGGIDVRYPMLDDNMVALSCKLPSMIKLHGRELRGFYKNAMKGFLPQGILQKSKHGFGLPFGIWLKDFTPLQELAYDSVASLKLRQYFSPAFLDHAIKMHQSGHASYYGELIWILMMLELWLDSHCTKVGRTG